MKGQVIVGRGATVASIQERESRECQRSGKTQRAAFLEEMRTRGAATNTPINFGRQGARTH